MSFINEKRFGRDKSGWQFDLLLGSVWDEILEICNSALQWQQLGYEDEEGQIPAEDVIIDIIKQGTDVIMHLLAQEESLGEYESFNDIEGEEEDENFFVDRVEMPRYGAAEMERYRDPYYRGSSWRN